MCMIYDALHYHQSNRPINRRIARPSRTPSFPTDAGKIKGTDSRREECREKERNGTNLRHLEHRCAAAIAISGPRTGKFDKRVPLVQGYGLAKHAGMSGGGGRSAFAFCSLWIIFKLSKIHKILCNL